MRSYPQHILQVAILTTAVLFFSCEQHDPTGNESDDEQDFNLEIAAWLQENVVPFTTCEPGQDYEDLMPLKEMIGDARIVSLGEATHGTSEFFKMKHRILEFLVQEMDFTIFAIEANWMEANLVNDYVLWGEGDPVLRLAGLYFWTWNTQEVLDMILWMRSYNASLSEGEKVQFLGFDMQFPAMAIDYVHDYFQKVDSAKISWVDSVYAGFRAYENEWGSYWNYRGAPDTIKTQCRISVGCVYDTLSANQSRYEALSSPTEWAVALHHARIVMQTEDHLADRGVGWRDMYMAENVTWILDQAGPEAKIVLWAHNGHIREDTDERYRMGSFLREEYGDDMVIFGFSFFQGAFNAITYDPDMQTYTGNDVHEVSTPTVNSYETYFHLAGEPRMFLDLRGIDYDRNVTKWLSGPRLFRSIGSVYDDTHGDVYFYWAQLPREFDVIIHFEDTTPSALLPFPSKSMASLNRFVRSALRLTH
ncbi:MAG: erythromycin esterase family protein [Fidelibacterota bacterium]|nr:MAG: erythromycin esterase family protein [Candidatus Neomarinimicrobiota bacterium]